MPIGHALPTQPHAEQRERCFPPPAGDFTSARRTSASRRCESRAKRVSEPKASAEQRERCFPPPAGDFTSARRTSASRRCESRAKRVSEPKASAEQRERLTFAARPAGAEQAGEAGARRARPASASRTARAGRLLPLSHIRDVGQRLYSMHSLNGGRRV